MIRDQKCDFYIAIEQFQFSNPVRAAGILQCSLMSCHFTREVMIPLYRISFSVDCHAVLVNMVIPVGQASVIVAKLSIITFKRVRKTLKDRCDHHVFQTGTQLKIKGTCWRGLFVSRIEHLQISASCLQVSERPGKTLILGGFLPLIDSMALSSYYTTSGERMAVYNNKQITRYFWHVRVYKF